MIIALLNGQRFRSLAWVPSLVALLLLAMNAQADSGWNPFDSDEAPAQRAKVIAPLLAWRDGPGVMFPQVHTSEQGEWLTLLKRKTSWIKVRDEQGREGWVSVRDVSALADATGEALEFTKQTAETFASRRWEASLLAGQFDGAPANSIQGAYLATQNISLELTVSQVFGDFSELDKLEFSFVHQLYPQWKLSPFLKLGLGFLQVRPKATLLEVEEDYNSLMSAGFGVRWYMTDRYFARIEVQETKVFTDRENDEEAIEWRLGLGTFF